MGVISGWGRNDENTAPGTSLKVKIGCYNNTILFFICLLIITEHFQSNFIKGGNDMGSLLSKLSPQKCNMLFERCIFIKRRSLSC
jgi:hypothetical protein